MQLIYLANIFEDNYNIVRDRFETGSVNVTKYMSLVAKKQRKFQYISLAQPIRQAWELLLGTKILKSFISHAGLWETLERNLMTWKSIWLMLLVICNDAIKIFIIWKYLLWFSLNKAGIAFELRDLILYSSANLSMFLFVILCFK